LIEFDFIIEYNNKIKKLLMKLNRIYSVFLKIRILILLIALVLSNQVEETTSSKSNLESSTHLIKVSTLKH
ncbi:MAG: hypothetical protein ACK5YA_00615, partial [bacterium]